MSNLNKLLFTGNLTADPNMTFTAAGVARCNFQMAINKYSKNKKGEMHKKVDYISVVSWSNLAETCMKYLQKGSKIFTEGRLDTYDFTDKEGNKRKGFNMVAEKVNFINKIKN